MRLLGIALTCFLFVWGAAWHASTLAAETKTYSNIPLGLKFDYPARFEVGSFKKEPYEYPPELKERGYDPPFENAVVLIEPAQLHGASLNAIPVGDVPALWLEFQTGSRAMFLPSLFRESYQMRIGQHTVYKFPGYPGPYGDNAWYYVIPVAPAWLLEITGHKYYFLDGSGENGGKGPETHYDEVIENIIRNLHLEDPTRKTGP